MESQTTHAKMKFLASFGVIFQSNIQSCFKTPVCRKNSVKFRLRKKKNHQNYENQNGIYKRTSCKRNLLHHNLSVL